MSFDTNGLPIAGSTLAGLLIYGAMSFFVTGQFVGERTIERAAWIPRCERQLDRELALSRPAPSVMPKLGCNSVFGIFGEDGRAWCDAYGGSFQLPGMDVLESIDAQKRQIEEQRLSLAADLSASRCECAANVTLESERGQLAIYAGSLRLIAPPSVRNLDASLQAALSTPQCAMKG